MRSVCVSLCVCRCVPVLFHHLCAILFAFSLPYLFPTQPCRCDVPTSCPCSFVGMFSHLLNMKARVPVPASVAGACTRAVFVLSQSTKAEESLTACPVFANSAPLLLSSHANLISSIPVCHSRLGLQPSKSVLEF